MNGIQIEAIPYDDEGILNLIISAASFGFSGAVEIFTTPQELTEFGKQLSSFPSSVNHKVSFEYGNNSGEYAYHLVLRATVIEGAVRFAINVRMQSFASSIENALAEFIIPAEPAAINELGHAIAFWLRYPNEPLVWQPRT